MRPLFGANYNFVAVDCGVPIPPKDGSVGEYLNTREGSTFTFQCNDGFYPFDVMTAMCTSMERWIPEPALLGCVLAGIYE